MKPHKVICIPATINTFVEPQTDKQRVIVYSRVIKYTGAGVQIRKKVRRLIADRSDWELLYVTTDLCETPTQTPTQNTLMGIIGCVIHNKSEILIIYSEEATDYLLYLLGIFYELCKSKNVSLYIANSDGLLSAEVFINMYEKKQFNLKSNILFQRLGSKHRRKYSETDY